MYKKNARRTGLRYAAALDEALCFGWIDGQIKAVDSDRFRQRWTPRRPGSIWSLVNRTHARRLIAAGRMAEPGLAAIRAARRRGAWQNAYSNTTPLRMPRELARALDRDPTARANFGQFAPSHRRLYIGWVIDAKRTATRERRIGAVVRRARAMKRPGIGSLYS
jgi:uncharacterized protein YdeI (YjbR/CyaY-like superfamily)